MIDSGVDAQKKKIEEQTDGRGRSRWPPTEACLIYESSSVREEGAATPERSLLVLRCRRRAFAISSRAAMLGNVGGERGGGSPS